MMRNEIGPLPPPTGLRRRRAPRPPMPPVLGATLTAGVDPAAAVLLAGETAGGLQVDGTGGQQPPGGAAAARNMIAEAAAASNSMALWKISRLYCVLSALLAFLAIVTAQTSGGIFGITSSSISTLPQQPPAPRNSVFFDNASTSVPAAAAADGGTLETQKQLGAALEQAAQFESGSDNHNNHATDGGDDSTNSKQEGLGDWNWFKDTFFAIVFTEEEPEEEEPLVVEPKKQEEHKLPPWLRWLVPPPQQHQKQHTSSPKPTHAAATSESTTTTTTDAPKHSRIRRILQRALVLVQSLLDEAITNPNHKTFTALIDKVISSTPRLLAISNLLLSLTFLLHTAVADWFLGDAGLRREWAAAAGRERLGGFLVFKLLLISAVVDADTLDLLILLSWYTLLSFLRSLSHLCAGTTQHTIQSGQPPRTGVLKLLLAVLFSDGLAAAVCVALFHKAGWGNIILLTCDCALLAVDVTCNILLHVGQVLEAQHAERVGAVEEQQMTLHQQAASGGGSNSSNSGGGTPTAATTGLVNESGSGGSESANLLLQVRQLDRRLEVLEQQQVGRMSILETTVFGLQLFSHLLTVGHFVHIWSLHGVQFTLIDGVLALHLHSALSSASKKIAERRNMNRIARDMDGMFDDASELELRKAAATGDVCCICLGTMTIGSVKKVGCGHLYHTSCLREVVERARSLEAARCPLCRASIMNGRRGGAGGHGRRAVPGGGAAGGGIVRAGDPNNPANNNNGTDMVQQPLGDNGAGPNRDPDALPNGPVNGELALFRFSTEGIFPEWLPVPAFSFEVVRRPSAAAAAAAAAQQQQQQQQQELNVNNGNENIIVNNRARGGNNNNAEPRRSLMRRLLLLAGVVSMTPQEEAAALEQLVDMFPQYDRADLLGELRRRGSSEAVAESILVGVFTGVARGGGAAAMVEPNLNWRAAGDAAAVR